MNQHNCEHKYIMYSKHNTCTLMCIFYGQYHLFKNFSIKKIIVNRESKWSQQKKIYFRPFFPEASLHFICASNNTLCSHYHRASPSSKGKHSFFLTFWWSPTRVKTNSDNYLAYYHWEQLCHLHSLIQIIAGALPKYSIVLLIVLAPFFLSFFPYLPRAVH